MKPFITAGPAALILCLVSGVPGHAAAPQVALEATQLEEVTVTAERREETLQRSALSVQAISSDTLRDASVTSSEDISKLIPSVSITPSGGPYVLLFLRGVGTLANNAFGDSAIAVNYDNVYLSRPSGTNGVFFDLARVEVLNGPQGTLYGRNATGGAVNIVPNKPTHEFAGNAGIEFGNFSRMQTNGMINLPLNDQWAARAAFQSVRHDGYFSDGSGRQEDVSARTQLRFDPNSDVSAVLSLDWFHQGGTGAGGTISSIAKSNPWQGLLSPAVIAIYNSYPAAAPLGRRPAANLSPVTGNVFNEFNDNTWWGTHLTVDWKTPIGTLTVIPAFRKTKQDYISLNPGFPIVTQENDDNSSVEARLASNDAQKLRYVAGLFWFRENVNAHQYYDQADNGTSQYLKLATTSYAGFGQATYSFSDSTRVTAGLRYTHESKTQHSLSYTVIGGNPLAQLNGGRNNPNAGPYTDNGGNWSDVTWKAGFEWDLGPESMMYVSASTGFKAGGLFISNPPFNLYKPETLTAYTVGSKNRFLNNRLQLNAELFLWKYKDQQISHFGVTPTGILYFPTENIGKSTNKGVEIETAYLAGNNTLLSATVQYLKATYDSFNYRQVNFGPLSPARLGCPFTPAGSAGPALVFAVDCSGFPAVQAPEWSLTGGIQQTFPLNAGAKVVAQLRAKYEGERYMQFEYVPGELAPSYTLLDANLSYEAAGGRWTVGAFINNLTDEVVVSRAGLFARAPANFTVVSLRPPRTFGLRLNANF
jgi:iron complex outermembrane recepter protein